MTYIGNVIVQKLGNLQTVLGLGPIAKHHWNGADHLHIYVVMPAFFQSLFGVPTVAFDFAEKGIVHHHPCATGLVVLELYELSIAKFLLPFG
jgi:hypothetical protein